MTEGGAKTGINGQYVYGSVGNPWATDVPWVVFELWIVSFDIIDLSSRC
jgi:hypothetical protein